MAKSRKSNQRSNRFSFLKKLSIGAVSVFVFFLIVSFISISIFGWEATRDNMLNYATGFAFTTVALATVSLIIGGIAYISVQPFRNWIKRK